MDKKVYLYNTKQHEEIQEFICENFGYDCENIAHEIKSECSI